MSRYTYTFFFRFHSVDVYTYETMAYSFSMFFDKSDRRAAVAKKSLDIFV
jgi:hypothetical protein